ncbi:MAG: type II toxin-antitoxin system RelE/ParE family toxin [bacterium]
MRVRWTSKARANLRRLHRERSRFSIDSADELVSRIGVRVRQLEAFPDSGRAVPEFSNDYIRELIEDGFRVIYERFPDRVEIIAIIPGQMSLEH